MQAGVDFKILEAAPSYGGRMKRTTTFVDFPIPLGAEWLHVGRAELDRIVNDSDIEITTRIKEYEANDRYGYFDGTDLETEVLGGYSDLKFINSTWFDFFEEFIVPALGSKMHFDTQVTKIDCRGEEVVVTDHQGDHYKAEKVIVTVPLKVLKDGDIDFAPALPAYKTEAIDNATVWGGMKVFVEFSEKFYPTFLQTRDSETGRGLREYYDAAYGQNTKTNVLGLFTVGEQAERYQGLSDEEIGDLVLTELDTMFEGIPSQVYVKHIVQNWNEAPFIRSAYLADTSPSRIPRSLSRSVGNKLFFAGEAYTRGNDWGGVHDATQSARAAVREILRRG